MTAALLEPIDTWYPNFWFGVTALTSLSVSNYASSVMTHVGLFTADVHFSDMSMSDFAWNMTMVV